MTGRNASWPSLTGICSMAVRHVLADLADARERAVGQPVSIVAVGGVDAARRVEGGEAFDFVTLAADAIDALAIAGRIDPATRIDFARSDMAVGVRAGSPRPDVASETALRGAVMRARRIGYSTGPSGTMLMRILERWGIVAIMASRLVQAPPGTPVAALLARGDVELGFQQLSELVNVPGIDVAGVLPPEMRATTVFRAGICTASNRREEARALLAFFASPEATAAKRRHGMDAAGSFEWHDARRPR